jgi:hypothetical protein
MKNEILLPEWWTGREVNKIYHNEIINVSKKHNQFSYIYFYILWRSMSVIIERVWIGEWIYWPLIHTTRNYK